MIRGGFTVRGFREMADKNYKRSARLEDLRWFAADFEGYIMGKRMRSMWTHQGQISGRYGEGSKKWARNSDWVAGVKGFNKPLFGSRGRSSIQQSYQFSKWYQRASGGALARFSLKNTHKAVKYLEAGYKQFAVNPRRGGALAIPHATGTLFRMFAFPGPMPPRWIQGFIPGDWKWGLAHAVRGCLHPEFMGSY